MTTFNKIMVFAAGLLLPASGGMAQTQVGDAQMVTVGGHCDRLVVGERTLTADCSQKLLNVTYPDRRSGFYFVLTDGQIVTFSGMDGANPTPDSDIIHLDKVVMTRKDRPGQPEVLSVKGDCTFGNPMKGPATITCEGTLADGAPFSAAFTTDGRPPA